MVVKKYFEYQQSEQAADGAERSVPESCTFSDWIVTIDGFISVSFSLNLFQGIESESVKLLKLSNKCSGAGVKVEIFK